MASHADGPLVSIVTPTLNPGPRLRRCLDSVARQTYGRVEHVVVDAGSTDGTVEILERRPGVVWTSEPDGGQADALNKGFALARGEVVGWLNADDVLHHESAVRAAQLISCGAAGVTYGDVRIVDTVRGRSSVRRAARAISARSFRVHNPIPQPGAFVSASALAGVGGVDPSFTLAMDFDLWLRLFDAGTRFAHVDATVATFEIHAASKTGRTEPTGFWREMAEAYRKSGRPEEARMALERARWSAAYGRIRGDLLAGRYSRAREVAREQAATLGATDVAARTPGFRRMQLFLAATAASPRLSRAGLSLLDRA